MRCVYDRTVTTPEGLRARRRRETARDIHLAALALAGENGFETVTVEAISKATGIAPRTFFNYFPTKEAAIVHGPFDLSDSDVSAFTNGDDVSYPQLLDELVHLLAATLAHDLPSRGELHAVLAVAQAHPAVLAAMLAQLEAFQRGVAGLVAARLDVPADDETAVFIAALALTILRTGFDRWAARTPADAEGGPLADIARAAALMTTLFESERTATHER
jgi:AcrR family transcriptional regulator